MLGGINTDTCSPQRGLHSSDSSTLHCDTSPICILHSVLSVRDCATVSDELCIRGNLMYADLEKEENSLVKLCFSLFFSDLNYKIICL